MFHKNSSIRFKSFRKWLQDHPQHQYSVGYHEFYAFLQVWIFTLDVLFLLILLLTIDLKKKVFCKVFKVFTKKSLDDANFWSQNWRNIVASSKRRLCTKINLSDE